LVEVVVRRREAEAMKELVLALVLAASACAANDLGPMSPMSAVRCREACDSLRFLGDPTGHPRDTGRPCRGDGDCVAPEACSIAGTCVVPCAARCELGELTDTTCNTTSCPVRKR